MCAETARRPLLLLYCFIIDTHREGLVTVCMGGGGGHLRHQQLQQCDFLLFWRGGVSEATNSYSVSAAPQSSNIFQENAAGDGGVPKWGRATRHWGKVCLHVCACLSARQPNV